MTHHVWLHRGEEWLCAAHSEVVPTSEAPDSPLQENSLGYVGDSLTAHGGGIPARDAVVNVGWNVNDVRVDGHIGRPIYGTNQLTNANQTPEAVVRDWRSDGFNPRVWVVALGANNIFNSQASWTTDMNNLLNVIVDEVPGKTVFIVGQVFQLSSENSGSTYSGMEDTMQARWNTLAGNRTDCTVIPIDLRAAWRGHFNGGSEAGYWSGGDGRHNTSTGYTLRYTLIADALSGESPDPPLTPNGLGVQPLGTTPLGV